MRPPIKIPANDAFLDVEAFLRLHDRLPVGGDKSLTVEDYETLKKKYDPGTWPKTSMVDFFTMYGYCNHMIRNLAPQEAKTEDKQDGP